MEASLKALIEQKTRESHTGALAFPELIRLLAQGGVESYHADFRERSKTYYLTGGDTLTLPLELPWTAPGYRIADAFDEQAVQAALRKAQQQRILYPQFVERVMQAGCSSYFVWIAGRRALYLGRRGEAYNEVFPTAD